MLLSNSKTTRMLCYVKGKKSSPLFSPFGVPHFPKRSRQGMYAGPWNDFRGAFDTLVDSTSMASLTRRKLYGEVSCKK